MAGERIGVGVIGASPGRSWAVAAHLPAIAQVDELALTAVATTRLETARETAAAWGVRHAFADAGELARHPDVDLVVVAVKAPAHAEAIGVALAAGKHVLSEWPLGVDLDDAERIVEAARAAGVVTAVGLQGYHSPGAVFVRELLAAGRIGRVDSVSMITGGDPLGGDRLPAALAFGADPGAGNHVLSIMAGHALATLESIAGRVDDIAALVVNRNEQIVVEETGSAIANGVPGQVALLGRLQDDALLSLSVHGGSAPGPDGFVIKLAGTAGTLTVTPVQPQMYPHWADWRVTLRASDGTVTELPVPGSDQPATPADHVAALYREIAAAITEGRPARPSFETGLNHHRQLAAIERASRSGARQSVLPVAT